jgi:translation initiation factor IF-3
MRRIWRKAKQVEEKNFRVNEQIRAAEVFLIDENGDRLGVFPIEKARQLAQEAELDLIEVNPKGDIPVVKIADYGQFRYEKEKKAHKQKVQQKKVDTKGIRLSVRISQHDFDFRVDQAIKFLEDKQKLKVELMLKGREKQYPEKAVELINKFFTDIETKGGIKIAKEQDLTKMGGKYIMILINKND